MWFGVMARHVLNNRDRIQLMQLDATIPPETCIVSKMNLLEQHVLELGYLSGLEAGQKM